MKKYMKGTIWSFLCMSLLTPFSIAHADSYNVAKVSSEFLTLRNAPTVVGTPINYLSRNTRVTILEDQYNGWKKVQVNNQEGYVNGKYIALQPHWEMVADKVIERGLSFWGTEYVYGAERFQTSTFDCSSFVQYLFNEQGIKLGWNAREQAVQGTLIPYSEMRKGDIMFFWDDAFPTEVGLSKVRHVGIYMGNGKILHTYEPGIGVTVSDIKNDDREKNYWYEHFLFAKRVLK